MQTGVFMEARLGRFVPCVLSLLIHLCLAAPGSEREESVDANASPVTLANPFGSGEEERRLLQHFIQSSLKEDQGGSEINSWEQEVFFLFRLYDFDRSGLLDGLEMMKLLSDYNSHQTPEEQSNEKVVVSMVDFLLQTQDQNQDGLLAPSELLSPSIPHTQDSSNNNAPHQEVAVEEKPVVAAEHRGEAFEVLQAQDDHQQQLKPEEQEILKQYEQHIPEAPAAEQEQHHKVPVHQGQPEM